MVSAYPPLQEPGIRIVTTAHQHHTLANGSLKQTSQRVSSTICLGVRVQVTWASTETPCSPVPPTFMMPPTSVDVNVDLVCHNCTGRKEAVPFTS